MLRMGMGVELAVAALFHQRVVEGEVLGSVLLVEYVLLVETFLF